MQKNKATPKAKAIDLAKLNEAPLRRVEGTAVSAKIRILNMIAAKKR